MLNTRYYVLCCLNVCFEGTKIALMKTLIGVGNLSVMFWRSYSFSNHFGFGDNRWLVYSSVDWYCSCKLSHRPGLIRVDSKFTVYVYTYVLKHSIYWVAKWAVCICSCKFSWLARRRIPSLRLQETRQAWQLVETPDWEQTART